ncbi:plasmodesmata-located protein 6-like [Oryza brachyantha]|uniref:plasmodesmata-located protein 6-like n=1 Tax=Oryza brachyantha TaxID=4533 RepID=UPI001ADCC8CD|nr:plasmodesmata-located protein 6-like [Oryza brachyantha]
MATATSVAATVLLSLLLLARARGADDDYSGFVYAGCSQGRYASGTPYASDVDSVLTSVANSAPYAPYANFTSPTSSSVAGLYQCRSDLPASVCTGCVRSAISRLSSLCAWATGGAVQLRACFVRYGNDTFLGKQDTAVLFKKCGGSPGDAGGAAMRDSALGALVAAAAPAGGGYRAGGSGGVQAMSQCVGDLGAKACSDCVSAAAAQLKAGCGYATAGEVYLGKCYARFWGNGGGGFSSGASRNGYGFGPRVHGDRLALAAAGGFFTSLAYFTLVLI